MQLKKLGEILKGGGHSLTEARQLIFNLLLDQEPQTMQVIAARALNHVDRATVYRTIDLFERLGIVKRLNTGWKYKIELSELFSAHHHHLLCLQCGRIVDAPENNALEKLIHKSARSEGFTPRSHELIVSGFCAQCRAPN